MIAVGTTSVRSLEGVAALHGGELRPHRGPVNLMIQPGFRFAVVQGLLTNFHLPKSSLLLLVSALIGGLAFAFAGGIGAALSLGARRGGLLTAVIVLPQFTPPVIFGGGALDAFAGGLPWHAGFALLCAYTAAAVALGPIAMAAACRNALS